MVVLNLVWSVILVKCNQDVTRGQLALANDKKLFAMERAGK